jgi:hypothetical protein
MPEETVAPVVENTEPAAAESETGLLSDAQLAEIFGSTEVEEPPVVENKPAETPKPAEPPKPAETPEGLDLTALDELDKPETSESQKPAVTPENEFFAKVQKVLPNEESLGWAVDALQRQSTAQRAAQSGDLKSLVEAFPFMGQVFQNVVQSYVAKNEEQIIENFIRKHSPDKATDPRVDDLQQRVNRFENERLTQQQQEQQKRQQEDYQTRVKSIDTEVNALFEKVRFTKNEADRRIVSSLVKVALAEDPKALNEALAGKPAAIRPLFAKAVKDYAASEKGKAVTTPAKETTTTPPKPILTGAGSVAGDKGLTVYERAANYVANVARRKG